MNCSYDFDWLLAAFLLLCFVAGFCTGLLLSSPKKVMVRVNVTDSHK